MSRLNPAALLALWSLPLSMFLGSFAWSFVYVSLPFYVEKLSTYDAIATLRWTGWILGISSLITVVTAPLSGRMAQGRDPKRAFVWVQGLQGLGFFFMAAARTLVELLLSRMLLGLMGAVSTFAFLIAGRRRGDVRREVAAIQSSMTLGQVLGPPVGAIAAARIGFRMSFIVAGVLLGAATVLVVWAVPAQAPVPAADARRGRTPVRELGIVCLLVTAASSQVFFLTAILPQVLPPLGIPPAATLEAGGLVLFVSGLATAVGSMATARWGDLMGEHRAVSWSLAASSILLAALAGAGNVWVFTALRVLQMLCIAPVFPLSVAAIAQGASAQTIGIVNSARIGASFLGPVLATTLLGWTPPAVVYLVLAATGLAVIPLVAGLRRRAALDGAGS